MGHCSMFPASMSSHKALMGIHLHLHDGNLNETLVAHLLPRLIYASSHVPFHSRKSRTFGCAEELLFHLCPLREKSILFPPSIVSRRDGARRLETLPIHIIVTYILVILDTVHLVRFRLRCDSSPNSPSPLNCGICDGDMP